jgi:hypothetical protein
MTTATVKYIANGYTVNWQGSQAVGVPASLYAAALPEAVYWLGRIFDPVATPPAQSAAAAPVAPRSIENEDPLLGQQANVTDIASGGFIVAQMPSMFGGGRIIETYAPTMDAVSDILTQIFTAPVPPENPV